MCCCRTFPQCFDDSLAGVSVAVGIDGLAHFLVNRRVVEKEAGCVDDAVEVSSDELDRAGGDGFGAFGGVAHDEHGLAQAGGFLLDAAAVGEDDVAFLHQVDETQVFERFDEVHVAQVSEVGTEDVVDGTPHVGVEVHGVDEVHLRVAFGERLDGTAHREEAGAEVLAAMSGDEHEAASARQASDVVACLTEVILEVCAQACVGLYAPDHPVEGVDDRVSRDPDALVWHVLGHEVFAAQWCGGEVVGREACGELAVHLLGPGAEDVVRAEAGLDVPDRDSGVEGGQGCGHAGRGVAMDKYDVGTCGGEYLAHACEHPGGDIVEVLSGTHDVEVEVGTYVEDVEYLVEHLTVLSGHADKGTELVGMAFERFDQRGHFDGLWARSEYEHDGFHRCWVFCSCGCGFSGGTGRI